jgi:DNA-binding CsgD family transcriptional regulator
MSRGTVKTHLSHVYAKLGVTNRTELATLTSAHVARSDNAAAAARSSTET